MRWLHWEDHQIADLTRKTWTQLAPHTKVVGPPPTRTVTLEDIEAELQAEMQEAYPGRSVRIQIPPELAEYYRLVDRNVEIPLPHVWDYVMYGRNAYCAPKDPDDEPDRSDPEWQDRIAGIRRNGLWQPVGRIKDRGEIWVCVDGTHPHWRKVIFTNDDTPNRDGEINAEAWHDAFHEYLQRLVERFR